MKVTLESEIQNLVANLMTDIKNSIKHDRKLGWDFVSDCIELLKQHQSWDDSQPIVCILNAFQDVPFKIIKELEMGGYYDRPGYTTDLIWPQFPVLVQLDGFNLWYQSQPLDWHNNETRIHLAAYILRYLAELKDERTLPLMEAWLKSDIESQKYKALPDLNFELYVLNDIARMGTPEAFHLLEQLMIQSPIWNKKAESLLNEYAPERLSVYLPEELPSFQVSKNNKQPISATEPAPLPSLAELENPGWECPFSAYKDTPYEDLAIQKLLSQLSHSSAQVRQRAVGTLSHSLKYGPYQWLQNKTEVPFAQVLHQALDVETEQKQQLEIAEILVKFGEPIPWLKRVIDHEDILAQDINEMNSSSLEEIIVNNWAQIMDGHSVQGQAKMLRVLGKIYPSTYNVRKAMPLWHSIFGRNSPEEMYVKIERLLQEALHSKHQLLVLTAMKVIAQCSQFESAPFLAALLHHEDSKICQEVIRALGQLRVAQKEAAFELALSLNRTYPEVCQKTNGELAELKKLDELSEFLRKLKANEYQDEEIDELQAFIVELKSAGYRDEIKERILSHPEWIGNIGFALVDLSQPEDLGWFLEYRDSPDPEVLAMVQYALSQWGSHLHAPLVIAGLQDPSFKVRKWSCKAVRAPLPEAVPLLEKALYDPNRFLRYEAVYALFELDSIQSLIIISNNKDDSMFEDMAGAVFQLQKKGLEAEPFFSQKLLANQDDDYWIREESASFLAGLGTVTARQTLEKALATESSERVRLWIQDLLDGVDPAERGRSKSDETQVEDESKSL